MFRLDGNRGRRPLAGGSAPFIPIEGIPAGGTVPDPSGARLSPGASSPPPGWRAVIEQAGQTHGVDPDLISAVIHTESNFRADAVSPKGALGAMQIMPETGKALGLENFFDLEANIRAGARYLAELAQRFPRTDMVLAAYNAGPGAVVRYGGVPPYAETRDYVIRVLARLAASKNKHLSE